jgi:hypothetical protein
MHNRAYVRLSSVDVTILQDTPHFRAETQSTKMLLDSDWRLTPTPDDCALKQPENSLRSEKALLVAGASCFAVTFSLVPSSAAIIVPPNHNIRPVSHAGGVDW